MNDIDYRVGIVMGSDSDLPTMQAAVDTVTEFGIPVEVRILSAHRTPDEMFAWARSAAADGIAVIVAGAGGAAHLPGMIASATPLPVIGVPVVATALAGIDALLSIVQMPAGVPVAAVAIGNARNAGLLAIRILGATDPVLRARMTAFQQQMHDTVVQKDTTLRTSFASGQRAERS
ncbi:MAG: 5-(carboxyamino)imidazole ribonucleotide mutase [Chloroflexota bacterium]|nr:5-(carboxyamino)imidazole ribonucleotide mutase [Chloroflexia bacterium]MDQ3444272.1 5-(carboxyamino)imidazole ribonucleotide mutase [Chloroflexota bacterium]